MSTEKTEVKKRRGTSLPLIIGFLILGVVGYYSGPTIMIYAFYLQEKFIAASKGNVGGLPDKSTSSASNDPTVGPGPDVNGSEASSEEASSASASGSDAGAATGVPPTDPSDAAPTEPDAK